MDRAHFFETMMDNLSDGIYILDDKGNYVFVNSAYIQSLNMPKSVLLHYNVHDFLNTGQIDICISDIVYREKRQVVMFQDVLDTQNYGRKTIRQMVISTPIFDESGSISHILAVVRPLDKLNGLYYQAAQNVTVSAFSGAAAVRPATGNAVIAESPAMRMVLGTAATVAPVDSAVLLTGESGTGKEVVAQYIHDASPRCDGPMVVINCASLPENLLEAELFGYEKGAFTGASSLGKKGLIEEADGGTLFLDEINSMPLNLQGKVLRAIETKTVQLGFTIQVQRKKEVTHIKKTPKMVFADNQKGAR
ncbi:MAG: PAS domain-containing protein, partial [Clostridia bacterium]|nr:PAS domain-containing protein [Clostridia bacterium]